MPGSCPEPSRRVHRAFSSPSSHSSAAPSPSQLSVYPLAGFHHGGKQQRGNRQLRSKCPARPYPARWGIDMRESVRCLAASAELLPCCTVISDPWDPLGVPRTLAEPRVRCEAVTVAIRAPRSRVWDLSPCHGSLSSVGLLEVSPSTRRGPAQPRVGQAWGQSAYARPEMVNQ